MQLMSNTQALKVYTVINVRKLHMNNKQNIQVNLKKYI